MGVPMYLTVFSCCHQNPLFNFCHFYCDMALCSSCFAPSGLPVLGYLVPSLDLGSFQPKTFSAHFSFSSSVIPIMLRLAHFILFHRSHIAFFLFFFICLSFCCSNSIFQITFLFFCIYLLCYLRSLAWFSSWQLSCLILIFELGVCYSFRGCLLFS